MAENLYIRVVDGNTFEHPIVEWNLRQFYPDLDPENPPKGFEKFIRNPIPVLGPYETFVGTHYEKIDGVWQDVHVKRDLTPAEKAEKIRIAKETFQFKDVWIFDEEIFEWIPPIEYPKDGNKYRWDYATNNWTLYESNDKILTEL
jgi:hypothetical protein